MHFKWTLKNPEKWKNFQRTKFEFELFPRIHQHERSRRKEISKDNVSSFRWIVVSSWCHVQQCVLSMSSTWISHPQPQPYGFLWTQERMHSWWTMEVERIGMWMKRWKMEKRTKTQDRCKSGREWEGNRMERIFLDENKDKWNWNGWWWWWWEW
jgi:hypothetical protein